MTAPAILTISSHVAWGSVGNAIITPALVASGFAPLAVPTVSLSNHPGLGSPAGQRIADAEFAAILNAIAASRAIHPCRAILTGYFAGPAQVAAAAAVIRAMKDRDASLLYLCDPVIGDDGGLYVPDAVATAIRDLLLPLADIATPNRFELAWLSGHPVTDVASSIAAAGTLPAAEIIATSVPTENDTLGLVRIADGKATAVSWPRLADVPHGTGDLFAALYLAARLRGDARALNTSASILREVIARSINAAQIDPVTLSNIIARPPGRTVAGVDGCRGRWLAVVWDGAADSAPAAHLFDTFAQVLAIDAGVIAVDMPIGLPDRAGRGGRQCESDVRRCIGERRSSVFAIPARPAVAQRDYREACRVALLHSDPPRKIAKQTFMLFDKIREVDDHMTHSLQDRVFEVHPELVFWAMNGNRPLDLPKKVKGKPFADGLAMRRRLLADAGFPIEALLFDRPAATAGADDILDACAAAWSARRIRDGKNIRFPETPQRDARGLRMEINA